MDVVLFWLLQLAALLVTIVPFVVCPHWLSLFLPAPLVQLLAYLALHICAYLRKPESVASVADDQPVALVPPPEYSVRDSIITSAKESEELHLVSVAALREALAVTPVEAVMKNLFVGENFLVRTPVTGLDFALVSYRQVARVGSGDDHFTLDQHALLDVVAAAEAAGVQGLWLDSWCYRQAASFPYDHKSFCATLTTVAMRARAVVWLPLSRRGGRSSCPLSRFEQQPPVRLAVYASP